ncbi:MAG: TIGR03118 family protein [Bryobacteraceae bacterium]
MTNYSRGLCGTVLFLTAVRLASAATPANAYLVHNLTADQPGIADFTDPNLVNPWGIITTATSPFWVSDGGTGLSTVYSSNGAPSATKPSVPPSAKGTTPSTPTGIVANATGGFLVQGKAPSFIFVTADGTVSGWASSVSATQAQLMVDNSGTGAMYYGLAISATTTNAAPLLYAANFASGNVDIFDTNYKPVAMPGAFVDPSVPAGYAPFNIQNLGGNLYVMYAKQNAPKTFATSGAGLGYVAVFNLSGALVKHLASNGPLNAPWGVAIAPATFGTFANDVLIGNFGDGTINAFDPNTGNALGSLKDQNGNTITYPGLWGLIVGNGGSGGDANAVYLVAGGAGQNHGILASIQASPTITSVSNAADIQSGIAMNSYISVYGSDLAPITRNWTNSDFSGTKLPTSLDGVSVTVNGNAAFVYYISPKQIDVLTPVDTTTGPVQVQVTDNGLVSNSLSATMQAFSPAFFLLKDNISIAALHSNSGIVGATTLYPGLSTPAVSGETIGLYGTGFGQTNPAIASGTIVTTPSACATTPTVTVAGTSAQVTYCGLISAGLYQVNVTIPAGTPSGNNVVVVSFGTVASNSNAMITVQ